MKRRNIKRTAFIAVLITMIVCVVLCGCRSQEQPETSEKPETTVTENKGTEENGISQSVDEKSVEPVKVAEDADFGNMTLSELLTTIKNIQAGKEQDMSILSTDLYEYLFIGPKDKVRTLYYDLADLNGDGYRELIIGGVFDNGSIGPLGVYMYKDGQLHVPKLAYIRTIYSDGTINSYQGNAAPPEDHKEGYYFRIDPSASDGIREVGGTSAGEKEFDWKKF